MDLKSLVAKAIKDSPKFKEKYEWRVKTRNQAPTLAWLMPHLEEALGREFVKNAAELYLAKIDPEEEYLRRAYDAVREINKATVHETRAVVLGQYWESLRRCRAALDEKLVQSALAGIAKITGLEKTMLIIDDKRDLEDLTDEELAQMWAEANEADDSDEEYDS